MSKLSAAPVHRVAVALLALCLVSPAIASDKTSKKTAKTPATSVAVSDQIDTRRVTTNTVAGGLSTPRDRDSLRR